MGPSPYFIGNPGEIKDNRGSDKIPRRQSVAEDCSTLRHCTHYTVQYSTVQSSVRGEESGGRRRELGLAVSGIPYLIAQRHGDTGPPRHPDGDKDDRASDRANVQTLQITKPEKCCEI